MELSTMTSTKDKMEIKNWINAQGARPARLGYASTSNGEKDPITVWFDSNTENPKKNYQALDWDEFFAIFDHYDYTFYYTEGEDTACCELVIGDPDA